ncbi:MAG: TrbC/VIRB2 family protein [candidate division WS2 bacterium ADurb.Bin280]|uniref:TrbC/VIRB2 family protein n=1 Tax=candidate division WS2 bacterium ADurb.Bin280 TaxID=1852829 RepID=A0A1V5SC77_9BACT|nr:MAG: TrbC/VIRB2 family protein [candidate division WS2 bacterium ADurb.Bin280]
MISNNKNQKILFLLALVALTALPSISLGANEDVAEIYTFIGDWYQQFILPVGTTLAGFVIMYGGIVYATSGGDTSKVAKGKELIFGAVSGLALLVLAVFIVRMITT